MSTLAAIKTARKDARKNRLRAFFAVTVFVLSALIQAYVAPHAALAATQELCVASHSVSDETAPSRASALGWHSHCGACQIATPPLISEKPPLSRVQPSPIALVYIDAWVFEPRERRRPGEMRSRAPPILS
ncbi:MAG: hypothetical protein FJX40_10650 [Alphaproteobacteria bacterium]|nr:hypothetical protein [Alphaproteobacteria bacterium]MBM3641417.1 hypothetical protein [Alphaproteobacteria bacterium]